MYYSILFLLSLMVAISNGQDWLEGGYVGYGNHGEIGQYFTDPIFYSTGNNHRLSDDPAIRQMQESLESPVTGHYVSDDPAIRQMQDSLEWPRHFKATESSAARPALDYDSSDMPSRDVEGRWQLTLTDDASIDLTLSKSRNNIFGHGIMTTSRGSQWVTASGSIYGRNLELEIVPASGSISYAISLDIGYWPISGTYVVYRDGISLQSGIAEATRLPE